VTDTARGVGIIWRSSVLSGEPVRLNDVLLMGYAPALVGLPSSGQIRAQQSGKKSFRVTLPSVDSSMPAQYS